MRRFDVWLSVVGSFERNVAFAFVCVFTYLVSFQYNSPEYQNLILILFQATNALISWVLSNVIMFSCLFYLCFLLAWKVVGTIKKVAEHVACAMLAMPVVLAFLMCLYIEQQTYVMCN